jgi:lipopolysaccharide/colanic/teichoic acid biosynthesis glycosyltransferase
MKLDLLYIEEWRFILDLIVLLKTPLAVIARKGVR